MFANLLLLPALLSTGSIFDESLGTRGALCFGVNKATVNTADAALIGATAVALLEMPITRSLWLRPALTMSQARLTHAPFQPRDKLFTAWGVNATLGLVYVLPIDPIELHLGAHVGVTRFWMTALNIGAFAGVAWSFTPSFAVVAEASAGVLWGYATPVHAYIGPRLWF